MKQEEPIQNGKTFKTYKEAENFKRKHKISWVHELKEGRGEHKETVGWHVIYQVFA